MLKYLWTVTQDLFVTVTLVTWMHALLGRAFGQAGRRFHWTGIGLGVAASVALAWVKGTSNKIISSHWNHYIFGFITVFGLVFVVLGLIGARRAHEQAGFLGGVTCLAGSGFSAAMIFYPLPGIFLYPVNFNTMGEGYLSAYYMTRLAGFLIALILLIVYSRTLYLCALHIEPLSIMTYLTSAGILVQLIYSFGRFFAPWVTRAKWLKWPIAYSRDQFPLIGSWLSLTVNYAMAFIWLIFILALLSLVICFAQNIKVSQPYDNPAQHRKLRARNRGYRRLACAACGALIVFTVFLTAVKGYDTRVIELSAPETYTVDGENIYVPLEAVNDFHLHRFEYKTENDVDVRWIVVRKPNSAAYGVGLDACDVCGNAGYYERNGQVVCRRCDVVMNINTIGFKGGCNPIPLSYEIGEGNIIFKLADIVAGEREFK